MERRSSASVATFFVEATPAVGGVALLDEAAARHARVRRLAVGDPVRVVDGAGTVGTGTLSALDNRKGEVWVDVCESVAPPSPLTLLVPVADRERMLWLAEKCAELAVSVWQPVVYARSRSVSPRGEGESFAHKVRARMIGAIEQSGGAWLPAVRGEQSLEQVAAAYVSDTRVVLDPSGPAMPSYGPFHATAVAVGPEGGFEGDELDLLLLHGWRAASLGGTTLRFETAGVAAAAIVRASQGR